MSNPTSLPDWNHLRAFLATAEGGSLSAAARALGLTQPTLSRQIAALEDTLSLLLFERVGRRLELTEAGRDLLAHVREMGEAAGRTALAASGRRSDIGGRVRVTAMEMLAATILPPIVDSLRKMAPQLSIEIVVSSDIQDLMRREADIAIRHVRPEGGALIARLVRQGKAHYYAARSYLDLRGRPARVADLAGHDWVAPGDSAQVLAYMQSQGIPVQADDIGVSCDDGLVAWEMAKAGLGICPMVDFLGRDCKGMEPVLPELLAMNYPVWLVTHREIHTSPRIRLVFDQLAMGLAPATDNQPGKVPVST